MKNLIIISSLLLLGLNGFGQDFEIITPNVEKIYSLNIESKYSKSILLIYLEENYTKTSEKDSLIYYDWGDKSVCSFHQLFQYEIKYTIWECREGGGMTESLTLPLINIKDVRNFVETLFMSSDNHWDTPFTYQPIENGPGCYYEIKETKSNYIINIYCGC